MMEWYLPKRKRGKRQAPTVKCQFRDRTGTDLESDRSKINR